MAVQRSGRERVPRWVGASAHQQAPACGAATAYEPTR